MAQELAQEALRSEANLRNILRSQLRAQEMAQKQKRLTKAKVKQSKAAKRLESCPGVNSTSVSGRRILPLSHYWVKETNDVKKEEVTTPTLVPRDQTGSEGTTAGLQGLNSTFSFSPLMLEKTKAGELVISD